MGDGHVLSFRHNKQLRIEVFHYDLSLLHGDEMETREIFIM